YSDPETPAGRLRLALPEEAFVFSPGAGVATRRCAVHEFDLTAHANRGDLLKFVDQVRPKVIVLGHGEADARGWFASAIQQRHPRIKVLQPGPGETAEA